MRKPYKVLFKELWQQVQDRPPDAGTADDSLTRAKLLGLFLQVRLHEMKRNRKYLAQALDVEPELVDAILEGTLPLSEIDNGLVEDIARAIKRDAEVLRALLGTPAAVGR